jgi:pSer/pThr/pTyr-binding forkhead associated (FHA) protein
MADSVATTRTTLTVDEVIVQAVQFFSTAKWKPTTQSGRIVTFEGRPPIPWGLLFGTIIGFFFFIIPGVIMYFFVLRHFWRLQNLIVTTVSISEGTEVAVRYPKHAKKQVQIFIEQLPLLRMAIEPEAQAPSAEVYAPSEEAESKLELEPRRPDEVKSSQVMPASSVEEKYVAPEPVPMSAEIEPSIESLQVPASSVSENLAKLLVTQTGRLGQEFTITHESTSIGRWDADSGVFPEIDLSQDDPGSYVSRRHARIFFTDGKYFIEDAGSTNGTFINKKRLDPTMPYELKDGDEIILGRTFFKFLT